MDHLQRTLGRLIVISAVLFSASAVAQVMPTVTPISSVPVGLDPAGGIVTRVTYEMNLAANDAGVVNAANDVTYATRAVTIGDGTLGTIAEFAASRAFLPVAAVLTAYGIYKWYTDANGQLTAPGTTSPPSGCLSGGAYWVGGLYSGEFACSLPGIAHVVESDWDANFVHAPSYETGFHCDFTSSTTASCYAHFVSPPYVDDPNRNVANPSLYPSGAPDGTTDPGYTTNPVPVTPEQVGKAIESFPDTWPQLLTDPQNGQPIITPEIAHDMDALKQQLAPKYGVDPTTIPSTTPDPNYPTGQSDPKTQNLPQYCGWATAACDYYKFVEDNWPSVKHKETDAVDCISPPSCSGDDIMCGELRASWNLRCDFKGSDAPPPHAGTHIVSELDNAPKDSGDTSSINQTGFGWGSSCPFVDVTINIGGVDSVIPMTPICDFGPWLRAFILMMAGLKAAQIVAGLRDVAK